MPPFKVTVTEPPPQPPAKVTLEMDEDTARALKVLAGLGTIHFRALADEVAKRAGFNSIHAVIAVSVNESIWERLTEAGV